MMKDRYLQYFLSRQLDLLLLLDPQDPLHNKKEGGFASMTGWLDYIMTFC